MLLTDVWEALEGLAIEIPTHLIIKPIAESIGIKFKSPKDKDGPSDADISSLVKLAGNKSRKNLPDFVSNSPTFQKMVEDVKNAKRS